jgi:hypothetical protein
MGRTIVGKFHRSCVNDGAVIRGQTDAGKISAGKAQAVLEAIATLHVQTSGLAVTLKTFQAAPFGVRVVLDDKEFAVCRMRWRTALICFDTPTEDRPDLEVDRWGSTYR